MRRYRKLRTKSCANWVFAMETQFCRHTCCPMGKVNLVGNNSGAFYTFLLHKLSHVYIDLITPIISTIFSPQYTLQQICDRKSI